MHTVSGHVVLSRGADGRQLREDRAVSRRSASDTSASELHRSWFKPPSHDPRSSDVDKVRRIRD